MVKGIGELPGRPAEPFGGVFVPLLGPESFPSDQVGRRIERSEIAHAFQLAEGLGNESQFKVPGRLGDPLGRPNQVSEIVDF